ncbi:MAG: CcmD family protein [Ignavibacteriaceae bacterium]
MEGLYQFLEKNSIFIVLIIVLIVWSGIFFYLFNIDKRIKSVEKELKEKENKK